MLLTICEIAQKTKSKCSKFLSGTLWRKELLMEIWKTILLLLLLQGQQKAALNFHSNKFGHKIFCRYCYSREVHFHFSILKIVTAVWDPGALPQLPISYFLLTTSFQPPSMLSTCPNFPTINCYCNQTNIGQDQDEIVPKIWSRKMCGLSAIFQQSTVTLVATGSRCNLSKNLLLQ